MNKNDSRTAAETGLRPSLEGKYPSQRLVTEIGSRPQIEGKKFDKHSLQNLRKYKREQNARQKFVEKRRSRNMENQRQKKIVRGTTDVEQVDCGARLHNQIELKKWERNGLYQQGANGLLGIDLREISKHEELLLDIGIFSLSIIRIKDMTTLMPVVALLLNKYIHQHKLASQLTHLFSFLKETISGYLFEQAFEGDLDMFCQNPSTWWHEVCGSKLWADAYKLISYVTCIVVHGFDVTKLKMASKYVEDTRIMKACESLKFMTFVSRIVENMCTRVRQSIEARSLLAFFHSADSYQSWFKQTLAVETEFKESQEDEKVDRLGLLHRISKLIEQGKEIADVLKVKDKSVGGESMKVAYATVQTRLQKLITLRQQLANVINNCRLRPLPFAMLVAGKSGQGKSGFIETCHSHFAKVRGLEQVPMYPRNPTDEHWNNFESWHWGILIDDAASVKPDRVVGVDKSLGEIIQIINPVAIQPPRAALEDKGRASVQAKFVCVSTNVPDLYTPLYFSNKAAVYRRLAHKITIEVKKEFAYANGAGVGLDSMKANHDENAYPDWWDITIEVPHMIPKMTPQHSLDEDCGFKPLKFRGKTMVKVGITEFLEWFNFEIENHFACQDKMLRSQEKIRAVQLCDQHKLPLGNHVCEPMEHEDLVEQSFVGTLYEKTTDFRTDPFKTVSRGVGLCALGLLHYAKNPSEEEISATSRILSFVFMWLHVFANYMSVWCPLFFFTGYTRFFSMFFMLCCVNFRDALQIMCGSSKQVELLEKSFHYCVCALEVFLAGYLGDACLVMERVGGFVMQQLGCKTMILLIVAALGFLYVVFQYFKGDSGLREQGQAYSMRPFVDRKEPKNCYARARTELDVLDVPKHSMSLKNKTIDDVKKFYESNLFFIGSRIGNTKEFTQGNALFIGGQLALVETHLIRDRPMIETRWIVDPEGGVNRNFTSFISSADVKNLGPQLSLLAVTNTPPKKALTLSLPPANFKELYGDGFMLRRDVSGEIIVRNVYSLKYFEDLFGSGHPGWSYRTDKPTIEGDCGSLIFLSSACGPILIGLHLWLNTRLNLSGALDLCGLEQKIVELNNSAILPGRADVEGGKVGRLKQVHPKAVVNSEENHFQCEVYGSFDGHRAQPSSRVLQSMCAPLLRRDGFTCNFGKPDMSWAAVNNQFGKMARAASNRHIRIMRLVSEHFVQYLMNHATDQWREDCHMIDQQSAVNGIDGVRFCDAMNIKTSAGHPFAESKKRHLFTKSGDWNDERFVTEDVQHMIDSLWEAYSHRQTGNSVFTASLKDEARKEKKIKEKNTRVFYGGPMAFIIVQRQLYLWFVRLVQSNHFTFLQAPGLDASGPEWHQLYRWLTFSPNIIAGDFAAFDITQDADELAVVYRFIRLFAKALGADQEHIDMMEACEKDTIFPLINFFGTLIRTPLNPSGQSLTVIVNGLINIFRTITLYVLLELDDESPEENIFALCDKFFSNVRLMTYGDDNIMASRDDRFNHTYLQDAYAQMGITYTMADKEKESVPFISMEDATFLKRKWAYLPEVDAMVAPLDEVSLIKMLYLHIPSKIEPAKQQMAQTLLTNHGEWFFYGKQCFDEWDSRLKRYAVELELDDYINFPTFEDYVRRYEKKTLRMQDANGPMCAMCNHDCHFINYLDRGDLRLCSFCRHCRFDEGDVDCLTCGLADTCEQCGTLCDVSRSFDFCVHDRYCRVFCLECPHCSHESVQIGTDVSIYAL